MPRFIGLDIGTSAAKATLIDDNGQIHGRSERTYPLSIPQPGWTEQSPEDWAGAARECLDELGLDGVAGVGLTGQMHGSVFLDAEDRVVRPALLWNDQRTQAECGEIEAAVGAEPLRRITGNPALTGFQLPKLLWLRNHEPENFQCVKTVLLPKDYIRLVLSGEKLTEPSDASGTGCFAVDQRQFSTQVLEAVCIDATLFPNCVESYERAGQWNGLPVAGGGGDQAAGAVGTGAVHSGTLSLSLGTSGVAFEAFDAPPIKQVDSIHNFCHATGGWHRMGVMLSCGGAVSWANSVLYGIGANYESFNAEAEAAPIGCEGLAFLPHLAGERCPFVDPAARGAWAGLGSHHSRGHLARAVMEGVCFTLWQCARLMREAPPERVRVTGGGARSLLWLQMIADVFGCPVETIAADEGPSFGAALLGGVASGHWSTVSEAAKATVRVATVVDPSKRDYEPFVARHKRLQDARGAWSAAGD
jgi:xylulokinase